MVVGAVDCMHLDNVFMEISLKGATVSWMLMNVLFLDIVVMEEFVTIHLAHSFVSANLGFKDCDVRIILMTVDQVRFGKILH